MRLSHAIDSMLKVRRTITKVVVPRPLSRGHRSTVKFAIFLAACVSLTVYDSVAFGQVAQSQQAVSENASTDDVGAGQKVDFDTEVIPLLTRFGCNAGACHGAALGRGGLKLSLFGSKPREDYQAIVRELEGRRVNVADPESSLLLRKATESLEHGGGERFSSDSQAYQLLNRWIESGSERLRRRQLASLQLSPTTAVLDDVDRPVRVSVVAAFDDGSKEDVTRWTVLTSDDEESVSIDAEKGELLVRRRGEHFVISRYLDRVQTIRLTVPFDADSAEPGETNTDVEPVRVGMVDRFIDRKLAQLRIRPSSDADDHEFARRVWLDLAGRLPTLDELETFVVDESNDKRIRLVDRLLDSEDFAKYWGLKWANVLGIDSKRLQPEGAQAYHDWLIKQFRIDAPWDRAAAELLTANGDSYADGRANFLRSADGPDGLAEAATKIFMGVRLRCANCHDHPLDQWNQDDYHGLAAIFAKLKRGRVVGPADRGEVTHPVTGQPAVAKIPGTRFLDGDEDGRGEFARWVTDSGNPYFAKAAVNRVWAQLMGRGLIDPVDDIRSTNPASHPELLDALADEFAASGYRFRPIIRLICSSDAYGRSSKIRQGGQRDSMYYSHFITRGLEAEVIANMLADVTGVEIQYGEEGLSDALLLTDNRLDSPTLDILGRCDRSEACETPSQGSSSLARVLHFLNGVLLNRRLDAKTGSVAKWLAEDLGDREVIDRMYRRAMSRPPSEAEMRFWDSQLSESRDESGQWRDFQTRQAFFADVFWGLITSETFLTNH